MWLCTNLKIDLKYLNLVQKIFKFGFNQSFPMSLMPREYILQYKDGQTTKIEIEHELVST